MKLNKLVLLGFAIAAFALTNCSKSDDETIVENQPTNFDLGKTVSRAFRGTIVDDKSNPLSNVTVSLNGKTVTTNDDGVFTMSNVSVKERFAYITATKVGYFSGSRTMMTHEGLNSLKIMMVPAVVTKTIQTGVVSTVDLGNTSVKFDGSFSTENGAVYNGAVKVFMMDMPANDPNVFEKMPGSLFAIDAQGSYRGLETFGMVNVELKGANNQKLQLTAGHKAVITMDIATMQKQAIAPAQIPMWFFDEAAGVWKEEGFSQRVGNKYVGSVAHFTRWNNDWAFVVGTLNVSVTSGGSPVSGVRCEIFRPSVTVPADHWNVPLISLGVTNANGMLSAGVPLNEMYVFKAFANGVEIYSENVPASDLMVRNIVIDLGTDTRPAGN
jgi:hypothetical protein